MTNEEKKLLQKLASGELYGFVGNDVTTWRLYSMESN